MVVLVGKIDSNQTGLRYCEEDRTQAIGVLPAASAQVWYSLEPNSYSDFGAKTKTVARMPINPSRQLLKGTLVDLDPSAGLANDLTQDGLTRLLQGFFFANIVETFDTNPYNDDFDGNTTSAVTGVVHSSHSFALGAAGAAFNALQSGDLVFMSGFTNSANNGLLNVSSITATQATGTFTETATNNFLAGDVLDIAGVTYTFVSTIGSTPGNVLLGGSFAISAANLVDAITFDNGAGTNAGVKYVGTAANPAVTAAFSTTINITALDYGSAADALVTTYTPSGTAAGAFGAGTLGGGAATLVVAQTSVVDETPTANARIQHVGHQGTSGDLTITNSGTSVAFPVLASTSLNFTTLPLQIGQWMWIGGDASAMEFATAADNGWARIRSIAAHAIMFDKTSNEMVTDSGASQTVQFFFGKFLINQPLPQNQVRRTYHLERTLGQPVAGSTATQAEYIVGAVPNELTFNMTTAEKITLDMTFLGTDYQTIDYTGTILSQVMGASAPTLAREDAYNTTSDVSRAKITVLGSTPANDLPAGQGAFDAAPTPLFAEVTELKFVIKNNLKPNKAVAKLGPFEVTAGFFEGSGTVQAYFNTVDAVEAVRNNVDASLDFAVARGNAGIVFDLPLLTLMTKGLDIKINEPIMLPLDMNMGADRNFNFTFGMGWFPYLPNAAMPT